MMTTHFSALFVVYTFTFVYLTESRRKKDLFLSQDDCKHLTLVCPYCTILYVYGNGFPPFYPYLSWVDKESVFSGAEESFFPPNVIEFSRPIRRQTKCEFVLFYFFWSRVKPDTHFAFEEEGNFIYSFPLQRVKIQLKKIAFSFFHSFVTSFRDRFRGKRKICLTRKWEFNLLNFRGNKQTSWLSLHDQIEEKLTKLLCANIFDFLNGKKWPIICSTQNYIHPSKNI